MDTLQAWGIGLIVALQAFSPALDGAMEFFSFVGSADFFTVLIPLLYWCVDAGLGARFAFLLLVGDSLGSLFKLAFHAPRPYWVDAQVKAIAAASSYGVPSGHALTSLMTWTFLARALRRGWAWGIALALIILIALSRLYLGVHFPHDVIVGWLIGAGVLALFWWVEPRVVAWLKRQSPGRHYLAALILPAALLILWGATSAAIASVGDPPEWERQAGTAAPPEAGQAATDGRSASSLFTDTGVLFGAGIGMSLALRGWRFDAGGPVWKRAARFALGIVGVFALRFGLGAIFPEEPLALVYALRFTRYAIIGLWVTGLAPWVFLKLKLAETR